MGLRDEVKSVVKDRLNEFRENRTNTNSKVKELLEK